MNGEDGKMDLKLGGQELEHLFNVLRLVPELEDEREAVGEKDANVVPEGEMLLQDREHAEGEGEALRGILGFGYGEVLRSG